MVWFSVQAHDGQYTGRSCEVGSLRCAAMRRELGACRSRVMWRHGSKRKPCVYNDKNWHGNCSDAQPQPANPSLLKSPAITLPVYRKALYVYLRPCSRSAAHASSRRRTERRLSLLRPGG